MRPASVPAIQPFLPLQSTTQPLRTWRYFMHTACMTANISILHAKPRHSDRRADDRSSLIHHFSRRSEDYATTSRSPATPSNASYLCIRTAASADALVTFDLLLDALPASIAAPVTLGDYVGGGSALDAAAYRTAVASAAQSRVWHTVGALKQLALSPYFPQWAGSYCVACQTDPAADTRPHSRTRTRTGGLQRTSRHNRTTGLDAGEEGGTSDGRVSYETIHLFTDQPLAVSVGHILHLRGPLAETMPCARWLLREVLLALCDLSSQCTYPLLGYVTWDHVFVDGLAGGAGAGSVGMAGRQRRQEMTDGRRTEYDGSGDEGDVDEERVFVTLAALPWGNPASDAEGAAGLSGGTEGAAGGDASSVEQSQQRRDALLTASFGRMATSLFHGWQSHLVASPSQWCTPSPADPGTAVTDSGHRFVRRLSPADLDSVSFVNVFDDEVLEVCSHL